jgi:hypothetical protein
MHQSERNRLRNRQTALLLAASDMEQAIRATQVLTLDQEDGLLARALETAIAVPYMRPFTGRRPGRLPEEYVPNTGPGSDVHATLEKLRHEVYAHTGKESGRHMFVKAATREGEVVTVEWQESWMPLSREILAGLILHFQQQRDRFRSEAASLHVQLHGLGGA